MDFNQLLKNCHLLGIETPQKTTTSSKDIVATTSPGGTRAKLRRPFNARVIQNFILVWLDPCIDDMNENDLRNSITELRRVVNTVNTFTDADQCIDFCTDIKEENVLMIISDEFVQNIVPRVQDITQINSIYVFCKSDSQHKQSTQQWPKVKGMFTEISTICQALKQDAQKCDQDSISISFVSSNSGKLNQNLDQLDPTFMYTQILKEILLTINFDDEHIKGFATYYRENFGDNAIQLNNINTFESDYKSDCSIWWYTHECCLYSVLNRALRMMEVDTIIKMGFFIRDLHHQIKQLHSEQFSKQHQSEPFTIYRGQSLPKADFEKMLEMQGGLISFNNFLSTSKDPSVALGFARNSLHNPALVGITFIMIIDPSISSTPFACINDVSCHKSEEEILFSMHSVFRIGDMIQSSDDSRLWQVDLIQTNDSDRELNDLTKRIRKDIRGSTKWDQLAKLLTKLRQFDKADELYKVLLDQTCDDREKTHFYNQLGWCKKNQKKYEEAITFYQKALEIKEETLPDDHPSFAVSYNDIGSMYEKMNEPSRALLYHEKGLEIQLKSPSPDPSGLASSFSKIGSAYEKMDEHLKGLSFYEKAVEILPSNSDKLAYSHNNIGYVYAKMKEYSKAIASHEKALEIQQRLLPANHPDFAQSYSSIGSVYAQMCQHSKAREFHQRAVDIAQRSLPPNDSRRRQWQKNLEYAKKKRS